MFSDKLKSARQERGLTLKALGQKIGMAESTVSLYESGKRQPDIETIGKLTRVLNISSDYLLGRTDDPTPPSGDKPDIKLDDIEFAFYGELRELDDEDKEELLKNARRMRELSDLRKALREKDEQG